MIFLALIAMVSGLTQEDCIAQISSLTFEKACVSLLFSKALGYSIVLASFMLKFPQILKIIQKKSVEGISLTTFYMETLSFTLNGAYGVHRKMPLSTYGETLTISVQCILQVLLFWLYGSLSKLHKLLVFLAFTTLWILPLYGELLPEPYAVYLPDSFWAYIQVYNILMNVVTKYTQIKENYSNGSTGNLSFITNFLNLAGSVSRILTTLAELNDPALLASYVIGTFLNGLVVLQFWLYWSEKPKKA